MQAPNGDLLPITPLTEKSIILSDNNDIIGINPITQQQFKFEPFNSTNINTLIQPRIITIKSNVHDKLNQEFFDIQFKKNQLRNNYQQFALQECSFKPKISSKSIEMKSKNAKQPRYLSPKRKPSQITNETQQSPKQNQNIRNYNKENVWTRLAKSKEGGIRFSKQMRNSNREHKKESISPKFGNVKIQEIVERLYNQQFERKRFSQPKEQTLQAPVRGSYNEKFVLHYFVREFYKALTSARYWTLQDIDSNYQCIFKFQIETDLCLITFQEVSLILDSLGFVPSDNSQLLKEIFEILQCPKDIQLILSRNLLCFLLCLQGYYKEIDQIPDYENQYKIPFPTSQNNNMISFINGNLKIYNQEQFMKKYENLNFNYLAYKKSDCPKQIEQYQLKTDKQTQILAQQYRQRVASQIKQTNIVLGDYDQLYHQNKQKLLNQTQESNEKICTFTPLINQSKVKSRYLKPKEQIQSLHEDQTQESLPKFIPIINQSILQQEQLVSHDTNQIIDRMIKGRVKRQLSQAIIKSGTCNQKKRQKLEEQLYEQEVNCIKQPIMYIDIILDNQRKERIVVYKNDTAKQLASQFIMKHRINQDQIESLTILIQQQLETDDQ